MPQQLECVNQARKQLKGRAIENLPPTHAALTDHIKRAAYQAGYAGHRWQSRLLNFHHQMNEGGRRLMKDGKHNGQHYQKLHKLVEN